MKLVNLTPHPIVLRNAKGEDLTIAPSGIVARVQEIPGIIMSTNKGHVPTYCPSFYGKIEGIPEKQEPGTRYIVSLMVANAMVPQQDFYDFDKFVRPGTGPQDNPIRDEAGRIIAVTRLIAVV